MDGLKWNRIKMFTAEIIPRGLNPVFVYCICSKNDSSLSVFSKRIVHFFLSLFSSDSQLCVVGFTFFFGGGGIRQHANKKISVHYACSRTPVQVYEGENNSPKGTNYNKKFNFNAQGRNLVTKNGAK